MPGTMIDQTSALRFAVARYIAARPDETGSVFHWPSFVYSLTGELAAATGDEFSKVIGDFVQAGWLIEESGGYNITLQAKQEARSGLMPMGDLASD